MTPEQKAAFVMAQSAAAYADIFAMYAANAIAFKCGNEPPYKEKDFRAVTTNNGINHNQIITFFRD